MVERSRASAEMREVCGLNPALGILFQERNLMVTRNFYLYARMTEWMTKTKIERAEWKRPDGCAHVYLRACSQTVESTMRERWDDVITRIGSIYYVYSSSLTNSRTLKSTRVADVGHILREETPLLPLKRGIARNEEVGFEGKGKELGREGLIM